MTDAPNTPSPANPADVIQYLYNNVDQVTDIKNLSGKYRTTMAYDPSNQRLTGVRNLNSKGEIISKFDYSMDAAGNVTGVAELARSLVYGYDDLYQLTTTVGVLYTYDAAGNRTSVTENGITKSFTYNSANQLLPVGVFPYDGEGNLLGKDISGAFGTTYQWDALNRLTQVHKQMTPSDPLVVSNYVYDGDNRRVRKTVGANVTNYLFDGLQVLAETDAAGAVKRLYNPGISFTDDKGNKFFMLYNGHGDVANLIDKNGNIVDALSYDPFGKTTGVSKSSNGARYVGGLGVFSDDDAGLQYDLNRWYDADLGRFLSRDPIGFDGGLNLYGYVGNNPLRFTDPYGLFVLAVGFSAGGGAGAGFSVGVGLYYDTSSGEYGTYGSESTSQGPAGYAGASYGGTIDFSYAGSLDAFGGPSDTWGGSAGEGFEVGGDIGSNSCGHTGTVHGGFGGGIPAEGHHFKTITTLNKKGTY